MFDTLDDLPPGRRLCVRLDLNAPVQNGRVVDNRRFARHAKTVRELLAADHRVALLAHQGRPGRETFVSLDQHADILADHLGLPVRFVPDVAGDAAVSAVRELDPGEVCLLENVRMCDDELPERPADEHADSAFVRTLAGETDAYVNDAYSAAHRSHASLVGFPERLPAYAGRVMETEYERNTAIHDRDLGETVLVAGGEKPCDIVDVIGAIGDRIDRVLLGGVAGELFLRADGRPVGHDVDGALFDAAWTESGDRIEALLESPMSISLPTDLAYAGEDGSRTEVQVAGLDRKPRSFKDIGTETMLSYADAVRGSDAVFVKGALGVFEDERFSVGTVGVLEAIADTDCFSVVGGGDTARVLDLYDLDAAAYDHVSIAGGAYLRALTGAELPAVTALERNAARA